MLHRRYGAEMLTVISYKGLAILYCVMFLEYHNTALSKLVYMETLDIVRYLNESLLSSLYPNAAQVA